MMHPEHGRQGGWPQFADAAVLRNRSTTWLGSFSTCDSAAPVHKFDQLLTSLIGYQ